MDYIICIPSYKRSTVCNDKTLSTLRKNNIPKHLIYVFVANTIEYKKSCKTEEGGNKQDSNVTENDCPKPSEVALKKFKELFEEENKKTSGGRRKNTRKKNKRHHKKRRSTRRFR